MARNNNAIWDAVNFMENSDCCIARRLNCRAYAVQRQRKKRGIPPFIPPVVEYKEGPVKLPDKIQL